MQLFQQDPYMGFGLQSGDDADCTGQSAHQIQLANGVLSQSSQDEMR